MYPHATSSSLAFLRFLVVCAALLLAAVQEGYGQRVYANSVTSGGTGVSNSSNAVSVDGVTEPAAIPRARISVSGSQTGYIQLQFASPLPQYSTVFLRVENETTGVVAGSISVAAYSNGTSVTSNPIKLTTTNGWKLYAINVIGGSFNQVRITASGNTLGSASIDILYAFYEQPTTECAVALGTTTNISGIAVASIVNTENAIDNNLNTYSTFSVALGLLTTLRQTAYLSSLSNPEDAITVTFSIPSAILSLGLLSNVTVSAYRGNTLVSSQNLNTLLTLDLLGLLNGGERYTVSYVPSNLFDRIEVSMSNAVGALGNLRVHEIQRTPAEPIVPIAYPNVIAICDGETATITADSPSPGSILRWYDAVNDGTLLQESTGNPDTYITQPLAYSSPTDTTFIYVTSSWESGCPAESERTKIAVVVRPKPVVNPIAGQDDVCVNDYITLTSGTAGGVWSGTDNTIATVDPSSGIVTGISTGTVVIRYTLTDSETSCSNYQEKILTVHAKPGKPDLSVSGNE